MLLEFQPCLRILVESRKNKHCSGANRVVTPLEWRGEWLRVRVRQPSSYCLAAEDWDGSVREGWVRWRDRLKGPWVSIWSRGC